MADGSWLFAGGEWTKAIEQNGGVQVIAHAKRDVNGRWLIGARRFGVSSLVWEDYCGGGTVEQEYKAKRRATALARKLIK